MEPKFLDSTYDEKLYSETLSSQIRFFLENKRG